MAKIESAPIAVLAAAGLVLRPQTEQDRGFLERLYRSVRWDELAPTGWSNAQKQAFLASQFAAQSKHFASECAGVDFCIIEHMEGPIGRLAVDRRKACRLHLTDIAMLPPWRNRGIGTALIKALIAEAGPRPVTLHVIGHNPAHRLYQRLGFREVKAQGYHILMQWTPV